MKTKQQQQQQQQQQIRVVVTAVFFMVAMFIYIYNLLHTVGATMHQEEGHTEHDQQQRAALRAPVRSWTENNSTTTIRSIRSMSRTALVCLEPECLDKIARSMARAFPDRPRDSWCIPASSSSSIQDWGSNSYIEESGLWQGLLLLKVPKAASSTSAGLVLRIAHRYNCTAVQWLHRKGHLYRANNTRINKNSTFLFAPVRNAASRAISAAWWFDISHWNLAGTDNDVIEAMKNGMENKARLGRGNVPVWVVVVVPFIIESVFGDTCVLRLFSSNTSF
jgi:hypothetical protein